jgi:hypothetical protein
MGDMFASLGRPESVGELFGEQRPASVRATSRQVSTNPVRSAGATWLSGRPSVPARHPIPYDSLYDIPGQRQSARASDSPGSRGRIRALWRQLAVGPARKAYPNHATNVRARTEKEKMPAHVCSGFSLAGGGRWLVARLDCDLNTRPGIPNSPLGVARRQVGNREGAPQHRKDSPPWSLARRILSEAHFEFEGDDSRPLEGRERRTTALYNPTAGTDPRYPTMLPLADP